MQLQHIESKLSISSGLNLRRGDWKEGRERQGLDQPSSIRENASLFDMGRVCELCGESATLRCNADDADLCWKCDAEVHSANYLMARHMRLVLCSGCKADTECRTSGPSPCPLARSCADCDPAHVDEDEANLRGSVVSDECDGGDSKVSAPVAVIWLSTAAAPISSAGQESLNDAHSSVEDENAASMSFADSSRGRPKRVRGGSRPAVPMKRSIVLPQSRKQQASAKKLRRTCSGSPVSVIQLNNSGSYGSLGSDISLEVGLKT